MMRTAIDSRTFQAGLLVAGLLTPLLLWPGFGSRTFSAAGFLPHSYCLGYQPALTWLNAGSDIVIGLSYLAFSATLAWRVHKARKSIPFSGIFLAFGVFIVASGLTHLIEVWTLWQPRYWLAGELKLITALAWVVTAIVLPPLVTRVIGLVQDGQLSRSRKLRLKPTNEEPEKRWRAVYENSAVGIILTDLSGRVLAANRAFQKIVGFTEEELQGGPLLEIISADDHESSRAQIAELLSGTRREYYLEKRYKRKDGTFVWTHSGVSLVPGTHTTPPMLLRIVEDISARKAAQAQLMATKDELAAELDAMTRLHELSTRLLATKTLQPVLEEVLEATIALQSADSGNVQLYNTQRRGLEIVAQRGFEQKFFDDFGFVEDNASACGRAMQNQQRVVIDDVQADADFAMHRRIAAASGFRAVQSTPLFSHDGEPLGMISTHFREPHRPTEREWRMTDLYARLAAEMIARKQAEDERQKLASLVENSRDFIGIATLEGQAQFLNRAGRELVGLQSDDEVRISILDYVAEEDRAKVEQHILPAVMRDGRWDGEIRFRHFKTGAVVPMLQHTFFIKEAGSERRLALATISRDITERKRAEAALHTAQAELAHVTRVMSMGELTASIAHEINQPLTAIVTNGNAGLRWLMRDAPVIEEARRSLEHIVRDGMRASEVTGRIRAFSRKTVPHKTGLDVNDVVEETATLAQSEIHRHQIALRLELATLPSVSGDRVQLQQVMLNLIMNGIDAMTQILDRPRELLIRSTSYVSGQILVAVQDCGIGLDPRHENRLFDAFFTTKQEGMGLGLSISRRIIEAHGGRLWAASNNEHGMTLSFSLPTAEEPV